MDEIRQKIEEFNRQLVPWPVRLKKSLFSCPAVLPAVAIILGIILQFYFNFPPIVWVVVFIFCIISYSLFRAQATAQGVMLSISVVLCFVCLGGFRLLYFDRPAKNDIRTITIDAFTFARIKAKVISQPVVVKADDRWLFSKYAQNLPYTSFYAKVYSAKTVAGWANSAGTIKFYISEDSNCVKIGDRFEAFCKLQKFQSVDNPGQFDTAEYLRRNNVYLAASVKSANTITIIDSQKITPFSIKAKLHQLASAALRSSAEDDDYISLTEAMLLGSRTKIDSNIYNAFIKTGLVHLIALSGLNVGILAGLAWWLGVQLGFLHRGRALVCITGVVIFLLTIPPLPSALRAGVMAVIFCLSYFFSVRANLINTLAISAIVLLLIKPTDFLDAGFQLSFAATLGIILFGPLFLKFLMLPFENLKNPFIYKFLKIVLAAFSTGCTAWLAISPIIAWHFCQMQLLTAVWTVPAIIPATVIIVLGTLKILLNPLLPTFAAGIAVIIDFSAWVLSKLVIFFADVPFTYIITGKPHIIIILLICLLILLWKLFSFRKTSANLIYPIGIAFLFIAVFCANKYKNFNSLQLTVLSVGHGQTAILNTNGTTTIIDAGSISRNNIGGNIVNPFLNYAAIGKIDSVFISHDDIDHYNGLHEIIENHKCRNIYAPAQFIQNINDSNAAMDLEKFLQNKKLSLTPAPAKTSIGKAEITLLWPNELSNTQLFSDNEASLVLLAQYAGRKILFCSDIPSAIQKQLMNLYPDLDIDIMIAPHHGSARTADDDFITFFRPEFLITSCAEFRFAGTSEQIKNSENSFYTCKDGTIVVEITPKGKIKIKTFKSRQRK
ncbi:MAG: DNA internalization-related competence protein ComEC/Rec2 [Phycisphaerae bacterium]|jgi:competence protein ComEC